MEDGQGEGTGAPVADEVARLALHGQSGDHAAGKEVGLAHLAVEAGEVADEGQHLVAVGQARQVSLAPVGLNTPVGGQHQGQAITRGKGVADAVTEGLVIPPQVAAYLVAHEVAEVLVVDVGVQRHGTTREVVQLKAIVAEAKIADEGLRRRRLAAEEHSGGLVVPLTQHGLHGLRHPRTGRGGMAVILGVAEILTAAVVLIQDLHVVQPALKEGGVGLRQQIVTCGGCGTDIVALSLGGADLADHRSVGTHAHGGLQPFGLVGLLAVVVGQIALHGVAKSRAVHAQHIPLVVEGGLELIKVLHPAVGRPDEGRRPGSGALPVHEDHHEAALGGAAKLVQNRERIGVGEHGIGAHLVGVVPAANGVGHDEGGILVPVGQGVILAHLLGAGREVGLKPCAVDLGGGLPATVGGLPDHGIVGGKDLTELHAAEQTGLQDGVPAVAEEIQRLDPAGWIVGTDVQPAILPQIGHHLGGDHVGEQGVAPQRGVLGLPEAEVGAIALKMGGDQDTLVVGKQDLTARGGVFPLQIGQSHAWEVHPLGKGDPRVGRYRNAPIRRPVAVLQGHGDGELAEGRGEIGVDTAVFSLGAGGGIVGGVVVSLPCLVSQTDTEQRRHGGHALHAVQDKGSNVTCGEIYGESHIVESIGEHGCLLLCSNLGLSGRGFTPAPHQEPF